MRKPRTVTGRVACCMVDALRATFKKINLGDFKCVLMLGAAQATRQGLNPNDFDNANGTDAFAAIFDTLTMRLDDNDMIYVTPAWRRVVISARARTHRPQLAGWRSSSDDLGLRTSS